MQTIWEIQSENAGNAPSPHSDHPDILISSLAQNILSLRSIETSEDINRFLFPKLENLHDPFLMKGMREAVYRILRAIDRKEQIMVHGDYDVDGVTGAAIISRTLEKLRANFYAFLPDRFRDGYGVSKEAIRQAKEKGVSLMITVDCGVSAMEQMAFAKELGIDTIILDHHQIHEGKLPEAFAILNPLQEDCAYPFKELSAGGLAFKLSQALTGNFAASLLDLAALSTVCDVAPLNNENRIIVKYGLDLISARKNMGISKLSDVGKIKAKKANTMHIGFILGPRINACGRMSSAETSLRLLVTNQEREAESLAKILDEENKARQKEEREVLKQAINQVEAKINFNQEQVIVVWREGWHSGVIGIVAQRLTEKFGRPSMVIGLENKIGKASARSVRGFHLFKALEACQSHLLGFGGHELAAGFSISEAELENFKKAVNEYASKLPRETFVKRFRVDLEVPFRELSISFFRELELFAPFGAGNPKPVFLTRQIRTKIPAVQSSPTTLRWWVTDGISTFEAVWNQRHGIETFPPEGEQTYDLIYTPSSKEKDGIETVLLEVRDLKVNYA